MSLFWSFFIAISPAIAILCYFYECDRKIGESYQDKFKALLMGMACIIPAGFIEGLGAYIFSGNKVADYFQQINISTETPAFSLLEALLGGFVLSALIEEALKLLILLAAFRNSESFKSKNNIVMLTVCLGLGFACIENIMYVFTLYSKMGHHIAQARAFVSLPMHAIAGVIMGSILAEARSNSQHRLWIILKALFAAILLHGTFNSLLFLHTWLSSLVVFIGLFGSIFFTVRYFQKLNKVTQADKNISNQAISSKNARKWWHWHWHSPILWLIGVSTAIAASYWIPQSTSQFAGRSGNNSVRSRAVASNDEYEISQIKAKSERRDYAGVIRDCDRLLRKNPQNPTAYNYRGIAYFYLHNFDRAIENYSRAIEIDSEYAFAYFNRAEAYFSQQDYDLALADYDLAIQAKGDLGDKGKKRLADIYANRGDALGRLRRFSEALASADRAIEIDSQHGFAWYIRSLALLYLYRNQEALQAVDKAIEFENYAYVWHQRGDVLYEMKRYPEAIAAFDKAVQIDPQYARAMYSRGIVLEELGRDREALQSYNSALALYPEWEQVKKSKQKVLRKLNKKAGR
ncbi:tetratricopeptide repeat protein [Pseudanabaena minima]|uniref:tetratricopeptide repeat protein n=1 Tax=Pseudanabaena minima TaxID=890415 RepID=UPI003DA88FF0